MAYRTLHNGDHVRITGKFDFSGRNAILIDAGEMLSRVQVQNWEHLNETPTVCLTINNDHLKIRHEPDGYIVDGRIDHAKKSALEAKRVISNLEYHQEEEYDEYDQEQNDKLVLEQLLERVSKLEKEILDMKGNQRILQLMTNSIK